ncbi:TerB family tellurite resistance protein, partial [Escherichia coli]|uniref:TerB family tellurite resistance protein n=1 Tax=Escherichia coli TaxID=562 RepID=UPI0014855541
SGRCAGCGGGHCGGRRREAEDVLDVAVAIAEADGEIEPEERKVLEEIAGVLGLRLENHL